MSECAIEEAIEEQILNDTHCGPIVATTIKLELNVLAVQQNSKDAFRCLWFVAG